MKLPEKKFLSVNEIAERWKVDRSTVLEMMVMGELMPSLFIDNVHCFIGKDMDGSNARAMSGEIYFTPPHSVLTRDSFELNVAIFVCNYVAPPGSYEDAFGSIDDAEDDAPIIAFADPQEFSVYDIRVRRHAFVEATERKYSEAQPMSEPEMGTSERKTLLRLVLGMAMQKYGYDPKADKNKATGTKAESIYADLESAGLATDVQTIRKYLKAAATEFPPNNKR